MENGHRLPRPLVPGDRIAILAPATAISPALPAGAKAALEAAGYAVEIYPSATGLTDTGTYAAPPEQRVDEMLRALSDDSCRAILCARGGYGCVQLLEELDAAVAGACPKWLIGFSDVSALHALVLRHGWISIHGSMAKALALHPAGHLPNAMLLDILAGRPRRSVVWEAGEGSRAGTAAGRLAGGNLAVLQALLSTPYAGAFAPGNILFVEDIAEPVYKVDRIFHQLRLAGILQRLAGLVIGRFTDYRPDANYTDMEQMLRTHTDAAGIPVAYGAPVGHIDDNIPLLHGAPAILSVTATQATITYDI